MMRRAGCCPMCSGSGASGEECTGGACWDCQGTGHPHLGRCRSRFLDWWHLKESAVVLIALAWTILTTLVGAPVFIGTPWEPLAAAVSLGPVLLALIGLIILGPMADRQIKRYGLPLIKRVTR